MSDPDFEIPDARLPEGFAERVTRVPESPAQPRPAATVVLVRDSRAGPETLLLRRNRSVGFVPGAYVFPGGRVDQTDASAELLERASGLSLSHAERRLGAPEDGPPAHAFYIAALREAFEETGILVGARAGGRPTTADDPHVRAAQLAVHSGEVDFAAVLRDLDATLDVAAVEYIAHWITPVAEPRRYDTRFFAARVERGAVARPDGREITEALWLSANEALRRHATGTLPMVFPTIRTLRSFARHESVEDLFGSFVDRPVTPILPRLVRTPTGVGLELPDEEGADPANR